MEIPLIKFLYLSAKFELLIGWVQVMKNSEWIPKDFQGKPYIITMTPFYRVSLLMF